MSDKNVKYVLLNKDDDEPTLIKLIPFCGTSDNTRIELDPGCIIMANDVIQQINYFTENEIVTTIIETGKRIRLRSITEIQYVFGAIKLDFITGNVCDHTSIIGIDTEDDEDLEGLKIMSHLNSLSKLMSALQLMSEVVTDVTGYVDDEAQPKAKPKKVKPTTVSSLDDYRKNKK